MENHRHIVDFEMNFSEVDFCDSKEPNEVFVTTGGETTAQGSLNWKLPASDFTSSVPSDLGSNNDESLAMSISMVPKIGVGIAFAASKKRLGLEDVAGEFWQEYGILHGISLENLDKTSIDENLSEYGVGTPYSRALHYIQQSTTPEFGFSSCLDLICQASHHSPSDLQSIAKACAAMFPPRLFGQPVLMLLCIIDPG